MNLARLASLLSQGLSDTQAATIIGCSPARISQIKKEESFQLLLADQIASVAEKDIEEVTLSAKYNAAEHQLLKAVIEKSDGAELRDVTAALRVIGERQEKMKTRTLGAVPIRQEIAVVSISIPSHALRSPVITMTSEKEVTSIGEATLAPLASTAVTNLFASMKERSLDKVSITSIKKEGENHEQSPSTASSEASFTLSAQAEESFLAHA